MKTILILLLLLAVPAQAQVTQKLLGVVSMMNVAAVVDGKTYLLQDDFEGTDGTDATADGWTHGGTDPGDGMELDTAQYTGSGSTSSMLISGPNATADARVYRTFTQQTSGTFTVEMDVRFSGRSSEQYIYHLDEGAYTWATSFIWFLNTTSGGDLYSLGDSTSLVSSAFLNDTWYRLEIEYDMDTNTADIWIAASGSEDGTADATSVAFDNNVDPNRFYFDVESDNIYNTWIDNLEIYEGTRVQD